MYFLSVHADFGTGRPLKFDENAGRCDRRGSGGQHTGNQLDAVAAISLDSSLTLPSSLRLHEGPLFVGDLLQPDRELIPHNRPAPGILVAARRLQIDGVRGLLVIDTYVGP